MRADVRLSTRFETTQNAHQVGLLLTITGETPVRRSPINVALVLDRSGSMSGRPLEAAKEAASRFASFLSPADRLSVVAFDDEVRTIYGPAAAGGDGAQQAIAKLQPGGSTNLSGGWLKGLNHVQAAPVDGTNRVVLLTDGQANQGITDPDQLGGMVRAGAGNRVTTTCVGFGAHFNEDLLEGLGRQGGGNYYYVESVEQMSGMFEQEIEGLVALAAQNVEVEITLTHPKAHGVTFQQSYPIEVTPAGTWRVRLNDLYATTPRMLGLIFHVEDVDQLGTVPVAQVRVEADVVTEQGIAHRVVTMAVVANLDGTDHVEPTVEQTLLRFQAAKAREEAIRRADRGDYDGAAAQLRDASVRLSSYSADAAVREEMDDLVAQSNMLAERSYGPSERKYNAARAMGAREMKAKYIEQVRRRRPDEEGR
jgi:Ca-activated chloride channel family protein